MRNGERDRPGQARKTSKKPATGTEAVKVHLERLQLENDLAKHIATLDTASILIVATFLEKLTSKPAQKELVGWALAGFIISLISVLVYEFALVMEASGRVYGRDLDKSSAYVSRMLTQGSGVAVGFTSLVLGLIALAVFAVVNL